MAYQSHIKSHSSQPAGGRAFTLLEVMLATVITAFVFAGVMSAYIFLGRSLARQLNEEGLESRTRLALYWFMQDVSSASSITAVETPALTATGTWPFTIFTLNVPGYSAPVYYSIDWSLGTGNGVLERQVGSSGTALKLLTNLSTISFYYYDLSGNLIAVPSSAPSTPQINIKQVSMAYTTTAGVASTGAQSNLTVVSPRVVMKNKALLADPTVP